MPRFANARERNGADGPRDSLNFLATMGVEGK
jgi:hypothetical protein